MKFNLDKALEQLESTPNTLESMLKNISSDWYMASEGSTSWSPFDIVGHLIHGEKTDWMLRMEVILSNSDNKTFQVFDREAHFEVSKDKSLHELLEEFKLLRRANIKQLKSLDIQPAHLNMIGVHPHFGTVNLKQLIATWVVHDLGHIAQIARVMAKQYKDEIGPWREYLSIVDK